MRLRLNSESSKTWLKSRQVLCSQTTALFATCAAVSACSRTGSVVHSSRGNPSAGKSNWSKSKGVLWKGKYELRLFQYEVCPFCNKARAYMEYHGIPFERVEVNPLTKEQTKFQEYKLVPFLTVNDVSIANSEPVQINGSQEIIDFFGSMDPSFSRINPDAHADESMMWATWADDVLVHLLPPNIYRTPSESLQAFAYISECSNFTFSQRIAAKYIGALAMFGVAKMTKKKYGIEHPRKELYDAVSKWIAEGVSGKKFHGGSTPSNADIIVYGVIRSIKGYDTWFDLLSNTSKAFERWFGAMDALLEQRSV